MVKIDESKRSPDGRMRGSESRPHRYWPHPDIAECHCVELTQGRIAMVDSRHIYKLCAPGTPAWFAAKAKRGGKTVFYAVRQSSTPGRHGGRQRRETMHAFVARLEGWTGFKLIDHIKHDTLDNRASQIRPATDSENQHNSARHVDNVSGFKGVDYLKRKGTWRARIQGPTRRLFLGYFPTPESAGAAYAAKAAELFGDFACFGEAAEIAMNSAADR